MNEHQPGNPRFRWPEPSSRCGALLYATLAGLIVWLLGSEVLAHIHIAISWH